MLVDHAVVNADFTVVSSVVLTVVVVSVEVSDGSSEDVVDVSSAVEVISSVVVVD